MPRPLPATAGLLALLAAAAASSGAAGSDSVPRYLWRSEPGAGAEATAAGPGEAGGEAAPLGASGVDDEPLSRLELPFLFPLFGASLGAVYASPNGFLQAAREPRCCSDAAGCRFEDPFEPCGLDQYEGLVAPSALDLLPPASPAAAVTAAADAAAGLATVTWAAVPAFSRGDAGAPVFSFSATLERSGGVAFRYREVHDPAAAGGAFEWISPSWLAGLRPMAAPGSTNLTAVYGAPPEDPAGGAASWGAAAVFGSYPPREAVRDNTTLRACPLSRRVCVHPRGGPRAGGDVLRVAALEDECLRRAAAWGLWCDFGAAGRAEARYSEAEGALECAVPAAPDGVSSVPLGLGLEWSDGRASVLPTGVEYAYGGEPGGACDACGGDEWPERCAADCAGVAGGVAARDACGACAGGTTGVEPGAAADCAGVCYGASRLDAAGACVCDDAEACPPAVVPRRPVLHEADAGGHSVDATQVYQLLAAIGAAALALATLARHYGVCAAAPSACATAAGRRPESYAEDGGDDGGDEDDGDDGKRGAAPGATPSRAREPLVPRAAAWQGDDPVMDMGGADSPPLGALAGSPASPRTETTTGGDEEEEDAMAGLVLMQVGQLRRVRSQQHHTSSAREL